MDVQAEAAEVNLHDLSQRLPVPVPATMIASRGRTLRRVPPPWVSHVNDTGAAVVVEHPDWSADGARGVERWASSQTSGPSSRGAR